MGNLRVRAMTWLKFEILGVHFLSSVEMGVFKKKKMGVFSKVKEKKT